MSIACDAQGQIEVDEILNGVNTNEVNISANTGNIAMNASGVAANKSDIVSHNTRLIALEGSTPPESDINDMKADIEANKNSSETNATNIAQNVIDITDNDTALRVFITANTENITSNSQSISALNTSNGEHETKILQNETDIAALQAATGAGKEAIFAHEEASAVNGGASTAAAWTPRNVATVKLNDIGAIGGATSVTVPAGTYDMEVHSVVTGSAHQTRINIGSTEFIYGISSNVEGISQCVGRVTLAAATVVSVETNVETSTADSGFGLSNTFGTINTYLTFHIEKVG